MSIFSATVFLTCILAYYAATLGNLDALYKRDAGNPRPGTISDPQVISLLPEILAWPKSRTALSYEEPAFANITNAPDSIPSFFNTNFTKINPNPDFARNATGLAPPTPMYRSKFGVFRPTPLFFQTASQNFKGTKMYLFPCNAGNITEFAYADKLFRLNFKKRGYSFKSGYGIMTFKSFVGNHLNQQCSKLMA